MTLLLLLTGCDSLITFGRVREPDELPPTDVLSDSGADTGADSGTDTGADTGADSGGDSGDSGDTASSDSGAAVVTIAAYSGGWTAGGTTTAVGIGVHPWHVAVADFDGDGRDDLAYTWNVELFGGDELHLAVRFQDASGALGAAVNLDTGHDTAFAGSFRAADLDGDGVTDLVAGHDDGVSVFFADGSGGFTGPEDYSSAEGTAVRVGDLDGDGDLDLVTVGTSGALQVWENDGTGSYTAGWSGTDVTSVHGEDAVLVDFDGDGALDLVIGDPAWPSQLHGLLGDGAGSFDLASPVPGPASQALVSSLAAVDLDADGVDDVVGAGMLLSTYAMFLGGWRYDGAAFTDYVELATPLSSSPTGIALGDLDGDGRDDLFAANALYTYGDILFDQGGGSWAHLSLNLGLWLASDVFPNAVAVGDLDGDGCGDLVWRTDDDVIIAPGSGC